MVKSNLTAIVKSIALASVVGILEKLLARHLPKVTHNYDFEKYYKDYRSEDLFIKDCYDDSTCYDLSANGLPNLPNDLGIGFINGIWNTLKVLKKVLNTFQD